MTTDLNFEQLLETVKNLTSKEKLLINDVLWENGMEIPDEHKDILEERQDKIKKNPSRLKDWDNVSATL